MSSYINDLVSYTFDTKEIREAKHSSEEEHIVVCIEKFEENKQKYIVGAILPAILVAVGALGSYYFGSDFIEIMKRDETLTAKILMSLGIDITIFIASVRTAFLGLRSLLKAKHYITFANDDLKEYKDKLKSQQQGR